MATDVNTSNSPFKPLNKTNERQATPAPINQIPKEEREEIDTIGHFEDDQTHECIDANAGGKILFSDALATEVFAKADQFVSLATATTKDVLSSVIDLVADEIAFTSPDKAKEEAKMHQVYNPEMDKPKSEQIPPTYNAATVIEQAIQQTSIKIMQEKADIAMGIAGRDITQEDAVKAGFSRDYVLSGKLNAAVGMAIHQADIAEQKHSKAIRGSIETQEIQSSNVDMRTDHITERTAGGTALTTAG